MSSRLLGMGRAAVTALVALSAVSAPRLTQPPVAQAQFTDLGVRVAARPAGAAYEVTLNLARDLRVRLEVIPTDADGPIGGAVRTLEPLAFRPRGTHVLVWDGTDDAGAPLTPGTYAVLAMAETGESMAGTHALLDVGGVTGPTAEAAGMSQSTGPCREMWITWAFQDAFGRTPIGAGDVGECDPARYGGGWASFDELLERVRKAPPLSAEEHRHAEAALAAPAADSTMAGPNVPRVAHRIQVAGDAACREQTERALDVLHHFAPAHYAVADRYVGVIECYEGGDGMGVGESPPRYRVGSATRNSGVIWFASTIAHDASHSKQFQDARAANPGRPVPAAAYMGRDAEAGAIAFQREALVLMGAPLIWLDYVDQVLETEYWLPESQRTQR